MATVPKLRKALTAKGPTLREEKALWDQGAEYVVGIDEVGRGAWAGPLTIGAVVVPKDRRIYKLRDSKQLTEAEREAMFDRIVDWALASSVGHASHQECDELGMSAAQKLAAARAIAGLRAASSSAVGQSAAGPNAVAPNVLSLSLSEVSVGAASVGEVIKPDGVLLDGRWDFVGLPNTTMLVKGDTKCVSIAAASILAKVTRDRMMRADADCYPGFNFESNKGYPCARHRMALQAYGPTAIHRRSWSYMDNLPFGDIHRAERARYLNQRLGDVQ